LHERVPPFPREDAMKIIEGEFDCPVSHIFSYVSDEPVAAASFGQVIASWAYLLNIMKLSSPAFLRKKKLLLVPPWTGNSFMGLLACTRAS
jgi:hypothetical protein